MIKIMQYDSSYLFEKRPELVEYIRENLNNYADGNDFIGSGMVSDLDYQRNMKLFVAWEHGIPIAWINITRNPRKPEVAQIGCFVEAKHRRKGLGSRLLKKATKWIANNGLTPISNAWDYSGKEFYKNHGIPQKAQNWAYSDVSCRI